jgi:hypothetical protein
MDMPQYIDDPDCQYPLKILVKILNNTIPSQKKSDSFNLSIVILPPNIFFKLNI